MLLLPILLMTGLLITVPAASLSAQTKYSTVEELASCLTGGDESQASEATSYLRVKADAGEDISSAVPAMREYVRRNVNREKREGVNDYGPNVALLLLMRQGDTQAIEHYLIALESFLNKSLRHKFYKHPIWDGGQDYLECIDPANYDKAYSLCAPAYEQWKKDCQANIQGEANQIFVVKNRSHLALHWLARFARDKRPIVERVNYWWVTTQKYSDYVEWADYLPAVIVLADQPELLPDLVQKVRQYPLERIKEETFGSISMVAALAPFREDARAVLAELLSNQKLSSDWDQWIAVYVDSACRLTGEARLQAFAQLREIGSEAYQEIVGGISRWDYHSRGFPLPRFVNSDAELETQILTAFGEAALVDKKAYKKGLNLEKGLGGF